MNDKALPFLVTSAGRCGAQWLGSSLHLHPEVVCSVGIDHPLVSMLYSHNHDEVARIRAMIRTPEDMPYGAYDNIRNFMQVGGSWRLFGTKEEDPDPYAHIFTRMEGLSPRRLDKLNEAIFAEAEALAPLKNFRAYGNVHGVTATAYVIEKQKGHKAFGGRAEGLPVMDLIGHPICRVDSAINLHVNATDEEHRLGNFEQIYTDALREKAELAESLEKRYHVDFSQRVNKVFFWIEYTLSHSRNYAFDIAAAPKMPRILFETIHSDRDAYARVFETLTRGRIKVDDAYLDRIFSAKNLADGRFAPPGARKDRKDPRAIYESWPAWQQQEVARIYDEFDLLKIYEPYGYDLSFLRKVPRKKSRVIDASWRFGTKKKLQVRSLAGKIKRKLILQS